MHELFTFKPNIQTKFYATKINDIKKINKYVMGKCIMNMLPNLINMGIIKKMQEIFRMHEEIEEKKKKWCNKGGVGSRHGV